MPYVTPVVLVSDLTLHEHHLRNVSPKILVTKFPVFSPPSPHVAYSPTSQCPLLVTSHSTLHHYHITTEYWFDHFIIMSSLSKLSCATFCSLYDWRRSMDWNVSLNIDVPTMRRSINIHTANLIHQHCKNKKYNHITVSFIFLMVSRYVPYTIQTSVTLHIIVIWQ